MIFPADAECQPHRLKEAQLVKVVLGSDGTQSVTGNELIEESPEVLIETINELHLWGIMVLLTYCDQYELMPVKSTAMLKFIYDHIGYWYQTDMTEWPKAKLAFDTKPIYPPVALHFWKDLNEE